MSKILNNKSLSIFLVVVFSLFFVAISLVAAKKITFLASSSDTAAFNGAVGIGTSDLTAALTINTAGAGALGTAIDVGSSAITMNYAAINDRDVVNKAYLSSLVVPAGSVSAGTFGSDAGNGDFVFPSNLSVTGLGGIGNRIVGVNSEGKMTATALLAIPSGSNNYTLRHNGTSWVANSTVQADASGALVVTSLSVNDTITFPNSSVGSCVTWDWQVGTHICSQSNGLMAFNGADWVFTGSDNVGIGLIGAPTARLDVNGDIKATDYYSGSLRGITGNIDVRNSTNTAACRIQVSDGLIVSEDCP